MRDLLRGKSETGKPGSPDLHWLFFAGPEVSRSRFGICRRHWIYQPGVAELARLPWVPERVALNPERALTGLSAVRSVTLGSLASSATQGW